jgi:hypothetical protein
MIEACEQIIDHPPIYITADGKKHRYLSECYENNRIHTLKPILILTYQEYQILQGTQLLNEKIKELSS